MQRLSDKTLVVVGTRDVFGSAHRDQLAEARDDWDGWNERSSPFRDGLRQLVSERRSGRDLCTMTFEEIEQLSWEPEAEFRAKLGNVTLREIDEILPVYVWIADDVEAVFAIRSSNLGVVAHGFRTSDQGLIRSLRALAEAYRDVPSCESHGQDRPVVRELKA